MTSLALDLQHLTLSTKLKFDSMHMQNLIKRTTKKIRKEQKNKLDEIWDNHQELRFEIETELIDAVERYTANGLPISLEGIKRIRITNKLVTFVLWYTTTKHPEKLEGTTKSEREFINAVAFELNQPKIYSEDGIADLKFYDVDSKSFSEDPAFITSTKKIKERNTDNFIEKVDAATKDTKEATANEAKQDETIIPFTFKATPLNTFFPGNETETTLPNVLNNANKQGNLPTETFKYLEKYIAPVFKDSVFTYTYNQDNDALRIYVTGPIDTRSFMIDTGSLLGSSNYAIIYPARGYQTGEISYQPVSIKDRAMIRRIFTDRVNEIRLDEVLESVNLFAFKNCKAHLMFDMSNVDLDLLNKEDKSALESKLVKIHDIVFDYAKMNFPYYNVRFRITSFKGIDNFSFISDEYADTSLGSKEIGGHYAYIAQGLSGYVKDNFFTLVHNDYTNTYNLNDIK